MQRIVSRRWLPFSILLAVGLANAGCGAGASEPSIDDDSAEPQPPPDVPTCSAPDMMLILDRTMSMYLRPDGERPSNDPAGRAQSKWHIAVGAIETLAAELDGDIRFGLTLFPRSPDASEQAECVTVEERIDGVGASNTRCEPGEVAVSPTQGAAPLVANAIDPDTTELCRTTPIGGGLATAHADLDRIAAAERVQYGLLITDGRDTCDDESGYSTGSLAEAKSMADAGIALFVVGFDGSNNGIDAAHLNALACAGLTAPDFGVHCQPDGQGGFEPTDPEGPALFYLADNAASLEQTLRDIAGQVCCGCVVQ